MICLQVLSKRERARTLEGFEMAKNKIIARMQASKNACEVLTKLGSDKNISFADMRVKIVKIEAQYEWMRAEKAGIESKFLSAEDTELTPSSRNLSMRNSKAAKWLG